MDSSYVTHRAKNSAAAYSTRSTKYRVRRDIVTNSTARIGPGQIRRLPKNRPIAPMPGSIAQFQGIAARRRQFKHLSAGARRRRAFHAFTVRYGTPEAPRAAAQIENESAM